VSPLGRDEHSATVCKMASERETLLAMVLCVGIRWSRWTSQMAPVFCRKLVVESVHLMMPLVGVGWRHGY